MAHVPAWLSIVAGLNWSGSHRPKGAEAPASIQTTINMCGKAMTDSKRQAHSKVVEMVLNSGKSKETASGNSGNPCN